MLGLMRIVSVGGKRISLVHSASEQGLNRTDVGLFHSFDSLGTCDKKKKKKKSWDQSARVSPYTERRELT